MIKYLLSKASTGKFRVAYLEWDEQWDDELGGFVIKRSYGQLHGKITEAPDIVITKGKASRTHREQATLQFNSELKKYLDKGYKEVYKDPELCSEAELQEIYGDVATNSQGSLKPMLAKQADKITNQKVFDKRYYASRKIDGLRVLIYKGDDGELHTSSRGATNYDPAMSEILRHPELIKMFNENPGLMLDGEAYKYGMPLQDINSVARTQKKLVDYSVLQFYWYDIVDLEATAEERINRINQLASEYNLSFDPERIFNEGELRIQVVPQVKVSGWDNMMKLHNDYVEEGWEGLVIRLVDSKYGPNKRSNDMIKIKCYQDSEFLITGYELGLRGSEDMVFICQTEAGNEFKAKPFGDREQKRWYVDNFKEECLGKMATVKYFYYSNDNNKETGVPLQPSMKCIRYDS
jgi:DNA ligase-1